MEFVVFFFFKQKTAYELRISDWSSDVCSSDLPLQYFAHGLPTADGTARDVAMRFFANQQDGPLRLITRPNGIIEHHRSEEHTSELQSLMRISYAVFCLKKKKKKIRTKYLTKSRD